MKPVDGVQHALKSQTNFNILIYRKVSFNRTPLMTFDPNIPTRIMFPLLQGKTHQIQTQFVFANEKDMNNTKSVGSHKVFPKG